MTDDALHSTRTFPVSRSTLYAALVDPVRLARWWGPAGARNTFATCDVRAGGLWTFTMHLPDGSAYPMRHRFVDVAPPERLVIAHEQAGHDFTLAMTLVPLDDGRTRLDWAMHFASAGEARRVRDVVLAANEQNFDRLAMELACRVS